MEQESQKPEEEKPGEQIEIEVPPSLQSAIMSLYGKKDLSLESAIQEIISRPSFRDQILRGTIPGQRIELV